MSKKINIESSLYDIIATADLVHDMPVSQGGTEATKELALEVFVKADTFAAELQEAQAVLDMIEERALKFIKGDIGQAALKGKYTLANLS